MQSVVIPIFNEEPSIAVLCGELCEVAERQRYQLQIILVDDGSTDGSWARITEMAKEHDRVRGIRLRRQFGKAAALCTGIDASDGEMIVLLDGDLQDNPAEIPRFVAKVNEGFDVVNGWKRPRRDPWHKVVASRVFNWLVNRLTGVRLHDHNCGFKCCRREVINEIRLYGELHRFIPVLAAARGFRVCEIPVNHRPRRFGVSKYGLERVPKGLLDLVTVRLLTGFGQRPQHLLGTMGLVAFLVGGIGTVWLVSWWFLSRSDWVATNWPRVEPTHLHQRPVFYLSLTAILLGTQLMSMGFLAELLIAYRPDQGSYSIAERTELPNRGTPQVEPTFNGSSGEAGSETSASVHDPADLP